MEALGKRRAQSLAERRGNNGRTRQREETTPRQREKGEALHRGSTPHIRGTPPDGAPAKKQHRQAIGWPVANKHPKKHALKTLKTLKTRTMKKTLSKSQAVDFLLRDSNARWTREGARAMIEHLEQLEEETGDEIEMDVVAIRCDWSEYESLQDWASDYGFAPDGEDEKEMEESIRRHIELHGQLIEFDGGVIVSNF